MRQKVKGPKPVAFFWSPVTKTVVRVLPEKGEAPEAAIARVRKKHGV